MSTRVSDALVMVAMVYRITPPPLSNPPGKEVFHSPRETEVPTFVSVKS